MRIVLNNLLFIGAGVPHITAGPDAVQKAIEIILGIAGAASVLVIAVAGFRYTISQGNPENAQKAKNTIIYACIGLAVSMIAFAIVNFVINGLTS